MKKYVLMTLVIVLSTICAQAQDVIFKSSSDSIQAQVLTVGTTEITYRKWNNLEGPIYSVPVNEVAAIRYANGSYDFFSNKNTVATQEKSSPSASIMLTRVGNTYYYDTKAMNKQATLEWLEGQNCPAAYQHFLSGMKTASAGWVLMATGSMFDLLGTILNFQRKTNLAIGFVMMGIGGALELACIPTIAVGYSKMHETVNVYNISCGKTAEIKPYWSVQASDNGIGVAYNF